MTDEELAALFLIMSNGNRPSANPDEQAKSGAESDSDPETSSSNAEGSDKQAAGAESDLEFKPPSEGETAPEWLRNALKTLNKFTSLRELNEKIVELQEWFADNETSENFTKQKQDFDKSIEEKKKQIKLRLNEEIAKEYEEMGNNSKKEIDFGTALKYERLKDEGKDTKKFLQKIAQKTKEQDFFIPLNNGKADFSKITPQINQFVKETAKELGFSPEEGDITLLANIVKIILSASDSKNAEEQSIARELLVAISEVGKDNKTDWWLPRYYKKIKSYFGGKPRKTRMAETRESKEIQKKFKNEKAKLEKKIEDSKSVVKKAQESLTRINAQLNEKIKKSKSMEDKIKKLQSRNSELEKNQSKLGQLKKDNKWLKRQINDLLTEVQTLEEDYKTNLKSGRELVKRVEDMTNSIKSLENEKKQMLDEKKKMLDELNNAKSSITILLEVAETFKKEKEEQTATIKEQARKIKKLKKIPNNLEEKEEQLKIAKMRANNAEEALKEKATREVIFGETGEEISGEKVPKKTKNKRNPPKRRSLRKMKMRKDLRKATRQKNEDSGSQVSDWSDDDTEEEKNAEPVRSNRNSSYSLLKKPDLNTLRF